MHKERTVLYPTKRAFFKILRCSPESFRKKQIEDSTLDDSKQNKHLHLGVHAAVSAPHCELVEEGCQQVGSGLYLRKRVHSFG